MKEFVGRGTHIFGPEPSLRLQTDLIVFAAANAPKWNPTNACGYHYMESGASPAQEVGFAFGNALLVLDSIRPQLSDEQFARVVKRISFFVNSGIELVPEIAKMRTYARLWPELCRREYAIDGVRWRAGCQVRSLTLTEQQPEANIIRIAFEALPVVLSADARVRALQLPGFREAIALPDQGEQTLSLRTQQILMYETGITDYPDIFEGSKVIEGATDAVTDEAEKIIAEMRELGFERAMTMIAERLTVGLVEQQSALDSGDLVRIGVNAFMDPIGVSKPAELEQDATVKAEGVERHLARLKTFRAERDDSAVAAARQVLRNTAESDDNILEASIALAKAGGTTGEWTATLEDAFGGRYQAPLGSDVAVSRPLEVPKADRRIRFFLAKSGLDGHINAVKLLAYACRQAGMEVIYSGLQQTPEAIAAAAVQEDADVIGISSLSGAHVYLAETLRDELAKRDASDIPVVMGGIIPDVDHDALLAAGVASIFTPKDNDVAAIVGKIITLAD